jgi:hypothetical protein
MTFTSAASSNMHATPVRLPCDSAVPRKCRVGQEQPDCWIDSCLTALMLTSHGSDLAGTLVALLAFKAPTPTL